MYRYLPRFLPLLVGSWHHQQAQSCGIMGFMGEEPAAEYLLEGLEVLQNRGYDAAGMTTIDGKRSLVTTKFASQKSTSDSLELLRKSRPQHRSNVIGIAHTRWATHGGREDVNAHPHHDYKNRIALVHNGTIENAEVLKQMLQGKGIPFRSETDTEVIAQLIGYHLDQGQATLTAVKSTLAMLEGTWGLVILDRQSTDRIIVARHGSPLTVGFDDKRMFVASEAAAFAKHTQVYLTLDDDEIAVIKKGKMNFDSSRLQHLAVEGAPTTPAPHPDWTIKEILEQPAAVRRTLNGRFEADGKVKLGGLQLKQETLGGIKHLILSGCGTSLFALMYGAKLMRHLQCFESVQAIDAAEVTAASFPLHHAGLLVASQSGETKDTYRTLEKAKALQIPTFSIVNQVGSLIARTTNCGVYLKAGRENAVASTKAFTTQVTALALTAAWFTHSPTPSILQDLQRVPSCLETALTCRKKVQALATKLSSHAHLFVLGKGFAEPIALEGALKIKEISYVHAEGFSGGALKHGPFALLEAGTPVILIILQDEHRESMRIAAAEVKARGAYNIVITDDRKLAAGIADCVIEVPTNGVLTALNAVIPLQLLAYEMSIAKGINPDKPRNLAKAVTVD